MGERIRILVVDDHHVVRQGLVALLNIMPEIEVVGEASDGLEAIALHQSLHPDITLMDLHAKAYLLKGMTVEELLSTIQAVHSGKTRIAPPIAEKLAERMSGQALTARELAVLERIVAGRANKEIASDLDISEATVKSHINNLLGKLGVSDRTHAATVALQRGIVHLK